MKNVKVVIGANYGDEGKGLMTRHFTLESFNLYKKTPLIILHNGTAQRGHTVDYNKDLRHIFHHFGSGACDGAATFFAKTFLLHPMTFHKEWNELVSTLNVHPGACYYDDACEVITPFDMAVDHATMAYIQKMNGERENGTCGFGSWCATDRLAKGISFTINDFKMASTMERNIMADACMAAKVILGIRGVDLDKVPEYKNYFDPLSNEYMALQKHFWSDIIFFVNHAMSVPFADLWQVFDYFIFENGQGLGLDKDVDNDWHTTSKTGLYNPYMMIKDKYNYVAEVCYVTRSYLTRHGVGPLEEAVAKKAINATMNDITNVHNDFQGSLRYGFIESADQKARIEKDFAITNGDKHFMKSLAVTHNNEFDIKSEFMSNYISDNPYEVNIRV